VKRYDVVRTRSPDGEIHLIITDLKLNEAFSDESVLDETKIREMMKKEAQKPLHLIREYE